MNKYFASASLLLGSFLFTSSQAMDKEIKFPKPIVKIICNEVNYENLKEIDFKIIRTEFLKWFPDSRGIDCSQFDEVFKLDISNLQNFEEYKIVFGKKVEENPYLVNTAMALYKNLKTITVESILTLAMRRTQCIQRKNALLTFRLVNKWWKDAVTQILKKDAKEELKRNELLLTNQELSLSKCNNIIDNTNLQFLGALFKRIVAPIKDPIHKQIEELLNKNDLIRRELSVYGVKAEPSETYTKLKNAIKSKAETN